MALWGRALSPSRRGWTLTRGRRISSSLFHNSNNRLFGKGLSLIRGRLEIVYFFCHSIMKTVIINKNAILVERKGITKNCYSTRTMKRGASSSTSDQRKKSLKKGGITSQNWRGTCISVYFFGLRVFLCPLRLRVFLLVGGLLLGLIFSVESAAAQPIGGDIVMATSEPSVNQSPATSEPSVNQALPSQSPATSEPSVNQALPSVKQAPATSEPPVNQALPSPSDVAKETGKGSGCCSSLFGCFCSCGCKHLCF